MDGSHSQGTAQAPGLDWMYKGPAALVNREDYLLGRTIDKSLKILEETEKGNAFSYAEEVEKDLTPASIFASRGPAGPVDVIRKIKEDPLYQIQKKEEESLKQLLKNPVRMKQLQQLAEQRQKESSSSSNSKKKKHKRKHNSSDSSDSDSATTAKKDKKVNINKLLAEKLNSYKKILEESSTSSSDSESESSRKRKSDQYKSNSKTKTSHSQSPSRRDHRVRRHHDRDQERDRGFRNSSSYKDRSRNRDYSSRDRDRRENHKGSDSSSNKSHGYERSSTSTSSSSRYSQASEKRKVLDESEMERKRREMMENAKWREDQLNKNVNKYREQDRKEEEASSAKRERDPDFIRQQLIKAASTGSVEQRIKSNSYNIQRSKASMSQNFARR